MAAPQPVPENRSSLNGGDWFPYVISNRSVGSVYLTIQAPTVTFPPHNYCVLIKSSASTQGTHGSCCDAWASRGNFGFPTERGTASTKKKSARVCRARDRSQRHEMGRSGRVPAGHREGTGQVGHAGHDFSAGTRWGGDGLRRVRDRHRGTLPRGRFGRPDCGRAHLVVLESYFSFRQRSPEEEVRQQAGHSRVPWRMGLD